MSTYGVYSKIYKYACNVVYMHVNLYIKKNEMENKNTYSFNVRECSFDVIYHM